jgi:hypothetical protein
MSILSSQDRHFTVIDGNVLTSGGSLNIANGQLAVINATAAPTQNGRKVLNSFTNLPKSTDFQIKVGKAPVDVNRAQTNKDYESLPFKLEEIVDFKVFAPKEKGIKVDEFIIGYNGKAGTELTLKQSSSAQIDITLCGEPMYMLGYENGEVVVTLHLDAPYTDEDGNVVAGEFATMQEAVENAVNVFNRMTLLGGVPITDYVDVVAVNSENVDIVGGTAFTFFNLTLFDAGDFTALGKVQAQYPSFQVVRSNRIDDEQSVYTIVAPSATVLADYTTSLAQILKGCEDCPAGYDEIEAGVVYSVAIEDEGQNLTTTVDDLPGFVTDSVVKLSQNGSVGIYSVVVDDALTDAEIAAFNAVAGAKSTATISLVGDVRAICENATKIKTAWVEGKACEAIAKTFTLTLADDECGNSRLAEVEAFYPELTIVEGENALCQTTFTTKVLSNIVCDECSEEFRALFEAEAPRDFGVHSWEGVAPTFSETAKMGIKFKGKEFVMSGNEQFRDDMPFIATSTRLKVAGGQPTMVAESWNTNLPFAVKVLNIASDPEALGGHLRDFEDRARMYFDGEARLEGNNYGKWILGQETRLKGLAQYVDYALTVDVKKHYQYLPHASEKITYHVLVELGRHEAIEDVLNKLATAAGLEPVQAFAK